MNYIEVLHIFLSGAILHDGASSPVYSGQARTMKIPLNPPFLKGDNYPSLWSPTQSSL